jgi:DNA end-binding protein Ku
MPRAIWTGTISLGLVNIPVRLHPATRKKDVRFREIDRVTGQRVHQQRVRETELSPPLTWGSAAEGGEWDPSAGEESRHSPSPSREMRRDEIVKGFEVAPDTYITLTPEEIEDLRPERTKTIDIEEFVAAAEVDPIYFDTGYHVVPQREYERPFALLVEALEAGTKLAICWIVLRKRRHLASLRPREGVLLLSTMYFGDEIVPVEEIAPRPTDKPSERELKMAALLVESMKGTFDPAGYEDGYRKRLLELIASRSGEARELPEPAQPVIGSGVEELMAALEASLKQVKASSRRRRAG